MDTLVAKFTERRVNWWEEIFPSSFSSTASSGLGSTNRRRVPPQGSQKTSCFLLGYTVNDHFRNVACQDFRLHPAYKVIFHATARN